MGDWRHKYKMTHTDQIFLCYCRFDWYTVSMSYCGSPKIQEHTTWLYESQSLKKVRGVEYTHWRGFKAALQYEEVVAVLSDHRFMRSGFAFLTDGMETRGISLALTSKTVYLIVLRRAVSFEERVSIDGQSINSSPRKKKKSATHNCGRWGHM